MSPLFRSKLSLAACATPLLSMVCCFAAHAEVPAAAPLGVAVSPAAFTVTPPASFAFRPEAASSSSTSDALPEAPQPVPTAAPKAYSFIPSSDQRATAKKYAGSIEAGQNAPKLTVGDKVVSGFVRSVTPFGIVGSVVSAGYSHLENGQPNYGVDGDAFAERFGASMAKGASESIFETSILAPILHEDTRYYVLGPHVPFAKRAVYIVTRPFITRTDSGHNTVNASLLLGYAGAAALTRVYYPPVNRNFGDEASGFGSSIGGAAIGFAFDEFADQLLHIAHLKHDSHE